MDARQGARPSFETRRKDAALLRMRSELFYALSAQPSYATSSPRPEHSSDLLLQLLPRALQRREHEMHAMYPRPDLHRPEQHVGLENVCLPAVHFGAPPGMPDIVED